MFIYYTKLDNNSYDKIKNDFTLKIITKPNFENLKKVKNEIDINRNQLTKNFDYHVLCEVRTDKFKLFDFGIGKNDVNTIIINNKFIVKNNSTFFEFLRLYLPIDNLRGKTEEEIRKIINEMHNK